jgi:hypothetical protein
MSAPTEEALVHLVRQHYPVGFPPERDEPGTGPPAYQGTAEFLRWQEAWTSALQAEPRPWDLVVERLRATLPAPGDFGTYTPAYHSACYVVVLYQRSALPNGQEGSRLVRVAGAVSLIAPVYLVYGTIEHVTPRPVAHEEQLQRALDTPSGAGSWEQWFEQLKSQLPPGPQLFLEPTQEMRPRAALLSQCIESTFGYQPFPLSLAEVRVPGIRVPYLLGEEPTLLNALFLKEPASLL